MFIDFNKIDSGNTSETALQPREIFTALPNKKEGKFEYPRDVQTQVWEKWFERRKENDLVIKMNTGSGKTAVGLLILKSCLNEGKGPAAYIVPDNYLVDQVINEAQDLGIEVTKEEDSPRFLSGKALLVVNIYKIINGKSRFGVGDEGVKVGIGSLMLDDAHACLSTIEEQFTLNIDRQNIVYQEIYECFKEDLFRQCETKAFEIENSDLDAFMQVPFWAWQGKFSEVLKKLAKHKNEKSFTFVWPLIKETLKLSRCVISSNKIEISPHCIPINVIPSIANAKRRIFMTATLVDDSVLASHFGVTEESINKAILPKTAGDIGDRMILLPQVINPQISDIDIKNLCKSISKDLNVVVIVPSKNRAAFWESKADLVLDKNNLYEGIRKLKKEKVGLTVLINRYDGVDLPKDACRLLVIDGLPDVRRLIDKVQSGIVMESSKKADQLIQTIEQGMGRGVRSNDDYCAVLLMGKNLTSQLYSAGGIESLSPGTKAQVRLSEQVSDQIKGQDISAIRGALMYCLLRNEAWVSRSKGVLSSLSYDETGIPDLNTIGQRKAYDFACINNYSESVKELDKVVQQTQDKPLRGYLKQCLAEYVNLYDPAEAQKILMSAASENPRLTKPIQGIAYHKLESKVMDQARSCGKYLRNRFDDPNKLIIEVDGLLEALIFKPDTAPIFEEAMKSIASYIGFNSQRPENDYGKGPDVLWEVGQLNYYVIECKNGVTAKTISKTDCNQLNGSGEWFVNSYDKTCKFIPILVHQSRVFEYSASPKSSTRIIDSEKLDLLRQNLTEFIRSLCIQNRLSDDEFIRERLISYKLRADDFLQTYTSSFVSK